MTNEMKRLRDRKELKALVWLWIFSAPIWAYLVFQLIVGMKVGKVFGLIGVVAVYAGIALFGWLAMKIAEYFAAAWIKTNAVRISAEQLPELHAVAIACAEKLGLKEPDVYVLQDGIWNAVAYKMAGRRIPAALYFWSPEP